MCINSNKRMHIMIKTKLTALTLAGLLAAASVHAADSTGPTDPVDTNGPRSGSSSMGQNTDGSTPAPKTSTPGTKGMTNSGTDGSTSTGPSTKGGSSAGTSNSSDSK
jgi:hypothetical protein